MENQHLIVLGEMLVTAFWEDTERTTECVKEMATTEEGQEMLRKIIRDDLGGAADVISAALWEDLK